MELEAAHKAFKSNPLLYGGIKIKVHLTDDCPTLPIHIENGTTGYM